MKQYFPLKKKSISLNSSSTEFLNSYVSATEIPLYPHPGSFGFSRKNHVHEGVDLYAEDNDPVFAIEDGVVIKIKAFTGEIAGSPWWNDTYSVLVEHNSYSINYGEITPLESLKEGDKVLAGDLIGHIKPVLKVNKGRPMAMLHLEMYEKGITNPVDEWRLNSNQPSGLKNPTELLIKLANLGY